MLQILSNLNLVTRMDLRADAWILASGVTGSWVAPGGSDDVKKPTAGSFAYPIWSESNRDGSKGFSPDVHSTGRVTVLYGKLRAITDQFEGTPSAGSVLYVTTNGKLSASGSGTPVAVCVKPAHTATYLSRNYTAIEFVTL